MPTVRLTLVVVVGTAAYLGVAVLGWGGYAAFFSHPARVALALAVFYAIIYFYGGPVYASCACSLAGHNTLVYYFIGIATLASYLPLYWYRKRVEDKRTALEEPPPAVVVHGS